ncbi:MAG: hypothetical protein AB8F65_07380 [Woeseiaceae bacterium]
MSGVMQWLAIVIEFAGLSLIALELYSPLSSNRLAEALEGIESDSNLPHRSNDASRRIVLVISVCVAAWVIGAIAVSIRNPALNLYFNIGMTVLSVVVGILVLAIEKLLRLGILLGRGNTLGGVGLVLALIGFTFEVTQLL